MRQIQITATTGIPPVYIYSCDQDLINCNFVCSGTPSFSCTYTLTGSQADMSSVIIKIVDASGCTEYQRYDCPVSPTPTPTVTPTLTPTTTPGCHCIVFHNTGTTTENISFIDCDGDNFNTTIYSGTVLYYCGTAPSSPSSVIYTIGDVCYGNSCVPISKTPTMTPTQTLTPTVTPSTSPP